MSTVTLSASTSREKGSRNARRLRTTGSIPAVIYGHDVSSLPISVNAKAFRTAMSGEQGLNSLIDLDADGKKFLVMAREIQRHPVRGTVSHIDFQVIDQQMFSLEIRTRPDQIPTHIDVDISELKVGSSIRIQDLTLPKGVEPSGDHSLTVVTTRAGRVAVAAKPAVGTEPVAE